MTIDKQIKLTSGHVVPTIGLGTYLIPAESTANVVYQALKVGYRHFDTAVCYENEEEVGQGIVQWLDEDPVNNKRSDVFYTTKLWNDENGYSLAKKAITRCMNRVKGLQYIDLLLIHSPLCGPVDRLETYRAMQEAIDEGIVKSIGVSNYGIQHLEQLLSWKDLKYKPVVNQIEVSPWIMRKELADWCQAHEIDVEAFSPLTHGQKVNDPYLLELGEKYKVTTGQILLRWSLQKGYIPLPKTQTISRLKSNLDCYSFSLTADETSKIDKPGSYEPTDWECTDCP